MATLTLPQRRQHARRRIEAMSFFALPGTLYLLIAYAAPLALLLVASFQTPDGLSLSNYVTFFSDPFSWKVLWNTLKAALLTTGVCLLIGYPMALALAQSRGIVQALLLVALILPLSVGVVVKAFAWSIVLRSDGVLNQGLQLLGLTDAPIRFIFTEKGLIFGAVNIFLPFMVLPIYAVLKLIDSRLFEAAATLGSGPMHRFWHLLVPLSLPGVIAGIAFVFSLSVSMFVVPTLLIGERYQTLSMLIARSYLFLRDRAVGSTVAVVLLSIAVIVVVASSVLTRFSQERH